MGKLYEFSALIRCAAVVHADSEEQALKAVEGWEMAWVQTGSLVEVVDVDLVDVREPHGPDTIEDEADEDATIGANAAEKAKEKDHGPVL